MIDEYLRSCWRDFSNNFYEKPPKKKFKQDLLVLDVFIKIFSVLLSPLFSFIISALLLVFPANFVLNFMYPNHVNETYPNEIINQSYRLLLLVWIFISLILAPFMMKIWMITCFRQYTDKYEVRNITEINDENLGYGLVFKNVTLIKKMFFTPHSEIQLFQTHVRLAWKYPLSNKIIWQKAYTWENFSTIYSYRNSTVYFSMPYQYLVFNCITDKKSHFLWLFYPLANFSKFAGIQGWKARKRNKASNPDNFSDEKIDYEIDRLKNSDCLKFNLNLFQHEPNTIVTILYYLEENHPTEAMLKEIHDEFYKITPPMEERIKIHNQSHELQIMPFQHEFIKSGKITAGDIEKFGMQLNKMDRFFDKFKRKNK